MRSFSIDLNGHRYSGTWKHTFEGSVGVRSDFGSTFARLGGQDAPVVVADACVTRAASTDAITGSTPRKVTTEKTS